MQLINDAYNLVIDAILGPETDHTDVKEPYAGILVTLKQVKIPIASVDMPSGKAESYSAFQKYSDPLDFITFYCVTNWD